MEQLFGGAGDWGLLILRIAIGIIFIAHGYPKFFRRPPIGGPAGFAKGLASMGIPAPTFFAWFVAILEFWGGIALILGLFTRWLGLLLAIDMFVAIWKARLPSGAKFASWQGLGWEFEFLILAVALALTFLGPGSISIDAALGLEQLADIVDG